jgi:hypothetical protein
LSRRLLRVTVFVAVLAGRSFVPQRNPTTNTEIHWSHHAFFVLE